MAIASSAALPSHAAPIMVAIADFDYEDSSGEASNQAATHTKLLSALTADIATALDASGQFAAAGLRCGQPACSADSLDQARMRRAATAGHAQYLVFGGIHKVSTLIQWGQVGVMDVRTGRAKLSRTVSFRGDDASAWQHAGYYIGRMVAEALK